MFSLGATPITFAREKELLLCLSEQKLPITKWGIGATKTPKHLYIEHKRGESQFAFEDGVLTRSVKRVQTRIFHQPTEQFLIEVRQVYHISGAERTRSRKVSISEKTVPNETRESARIRSLVEELGLESRELKKCTFGPFNTRRKEPAYSSSYPGLLTRRVNYRSDWDMPTKFYVPEGYIEEQAGFRTSYFAWTPIADM